MNLKESFRYQNYLKLMFDLCRQDITNMSHAFSATKLHKRHDANPAAEDMIEEPEPTDYYSNDDVIAFMMAILKEKEKLCVAIAKTKEKIMKETEIPIDQAVECNKMYRDAVDSICRMLGFKASKRIERGQAYLLNNEGNQCAYYYDVEVTRSEAFNRKAAKEIAKNISDMADTTSKEVDLAMVNYEVDFTPMFDVNDSFDDSIEKFMDSRSTISETE